jgi:hypothetical protein
MEEMINTYKVLVRKSEGNEKRGGLRGRHANNMDSFGSR